MEEDSRWLALDSSLNPYSIELWKPGQVTSLLTYEIGIILCTCFENQREIMSSPRPLVGRQ